MPATKSRTLRRPAMASVVGLGVLITAIVGMTFFQQGFVAAGRCATEMVMPVSLMWLSLFAVSLWHFGSRSLGRAVFFLVLFLCLTVLGNGNFGNAMMMRVETQLVDDPHPAFERHFSMPESHGRGGPFGALDAVVTLGGSANLVMSDFAEVNAEGERIVSAAQAYHTGAVRGIITTGTSTDRIGNPNELSRDLLVSLGVPEERIFLIDGENTQQEMSSLVSFLENPPERWGEMVNDGSRSEPVVGLITSAFHMPRAMRLSKTVGLDLVPLPCAFRTQRVRRPWVASSLVPTAGNLDRLGLVIKESIAYVLGR